MDPKEVWVPDIVLYNKWVFITKQFHSNDLIFISRHSAAHSCKRDKLASMAKGVRLRRWPRSERPWTLPDKSQPWKPRRQEPNKFAYVKNKHRVFARFVRAFYIFVHFEVPLVLLLMWNDLFCSRVDDVSTWRQIFIHFFFLTPDFSYHYNSRRLSRHFARGRTCIVEKWL